MISLKGIVGVWIFVSSWVFAQKDDGQMDDQSIARSTQSTSLAAKNCWKLGGTLEAIVKANGSNDYCVVESQELYNKMNERGLIESFSDEGIYHISHSNPPQATCLSLRGFEQLRVVPSRAPAVITTVVSKTYCFVRPWTLFRAINVLKE